MNEDLQAQIDVLRLRIKKLVLLVADGELARIGQPCQLSSMERAELMASLSAECIDGPVIGRVQS